VASGRHSQVFTGLSPFNRYRDTLFQCMEPNLAMALAPACVSRRAFSLTMIRAAPTWDLAHAENGRRRIGGRSVVLFLPHTVNFLKRGLSNSTRLRCCDEFCGYGEF
jgi:hypothetical protein